MKGRWDGMKRKPLTEAAKRRWYRTMPVLSAIYSRLPAHDIGEQVRKTEWGALYKAGDHYSLVENPPEIPDA